MNQKNRIQLIRNHLDEVRVIVRKQPLNELLGFLSALNFPNDKAWRIFQERIKSNPQIAKSYRIFIPLLAKYAILNSNDHIGQSNRNFEKAFSDIDLAIQRLIEIKDWLPNELFNDPEQALTTWEFLVANQQFLYQEIPTNTFARCFWLFDRIPKEEKYLDKINIAETFKDIYSFSLDRIWLITANIIHQYKGGFQYFDNTDEKFKESKTYFDRFSINYSDFRNLAKDKSKSLTGLSTQFYGYSSFDDYPIIKLENGYVIICPYYLVRRFYIPMYFDLLEYYQKSENLKQNSFSTLFGEVFQEYVERQLEILKDECECIAEFEYDSDKSKKFCDFTLLYKNSAIFIEVKKNLLPVQAKFELDKEKLKKSIKNSFVKGLIQIHNKISHISNKIKGLEKFYTIENFYPVVVTFDDTYRLNGFYIRSIVDEILAEEGISFSNKWQIITIRELENILPICSKDRTLLSLLKMKLSDNNSLHQDFDDFLREKKIEVIHNQLIQYVIKGELEKFNKEKPFK